MPHQIGLEQGLGWASPTAEQPVSQARACTVGETGAPPDGQLDPAGFAAYLPLVQRLVHQLARRLPANVERDDLLAAGAFGLIESLRRNQGSDGPTFEWYARIRIRGAIFDELRAQDWLSRRARGRVTRDEAMAATCFVSLEEVGGHEDSGALASPEDPAAVIEARSELRALLRAIDQLPERERLIVARHYLDGVKLKDLGAELGVSEPRISQLHARALDRLRVLLLDAAA